jgi:flagellar basal body-associated protein FliL
MAVKKHGVIIDTPTEARQAEPGPSILLLLIVSVSVAVVAMAIVWFVFFRT